MDNNRTILAVVLIVLLWSGYSLFFAPQVPVPQINEEQVVANSDTNVEVVADKSVAVTTTVDKNHVQPLSTVVDETFFTVSSVNYDIEISSVGAAINLIALKQYREENDSSSPFVKIFDGESFQQTSFITSGSDGLYLPANLNYKVADGKKNIELNGEEVTVSFVASTDALTIIKNYTFYPTTYSFDLSIQLISNADLVNGKLNLSLLSAWDKEDKAEMYSFIGPVTYNGEELLEDDSEELGQSPKIYKENTVWSGYTSKYFLKAIYPGEQIDKLFITAGEGYVENRFTTPLISLQTGEKTTFNYSSYFGPKQDEYLVAAGHEFKDAIHYGFFHPLAKPLMVVLKFFYNFIGNYGISVILLTICIKLLFWPLTQKSYKSMKGMQKLQPEMKKMREKYGSDKQKLNQEMMSFYKDNKVNPLGGCLPMVIQIPVFFALYRVLLGSIELRHAPFMMWITDLSAKDPYYVTPLIMGVTMFFQQKMTPTNMDPTQEKIMLMMPVVFTFMFLNFPAGLVLYWLTNNLLTILQQYLIRRQPD